MIKNICVNVSVNNEFYEMIRTKILSFDNHIERKKVCQAFYPIKTIKEITIVTELFKANASLATTILLSLNFEDFCCTYEQFPDKLNDSLNKLFGGDIYEQEKWICDYIVYERIMQRTDAEEYIKQLRESGKFTPEQLSLEMWSNRTCSYGTINFLVGKHDQGHLVLQARCDGGALRKRITDETVHRHGGVTVPIAVNEKTENMIYDWLYKRYNISEKA